MIVLGADVYVYCVYIFRLINHSNMLWLSEGYDNNS